MEDCGGTSGRFSDAALAGLMELSAGDWTSLLIPLVGAGDAAEGARVLAAAEVAAGANGADADGTGVDAFAEADEERTPLPLMPSWTSRCCLRRASGSTEKPGVAEPRAAGVTASDSGDRRPSLIFSCCLGWAGMLILSFVPVCGGSSTLAFACARRSLKTFWEM